MPQLALNDLEVKLVQLLSEYRELAAENRVLRKQVAKLEYERNCLMEKNDKAVVKVEHIISQLREELNERIT